MTTSDKMIEYVERNAVLAKAAPVPGCFCNMISSWDVVHLPAADVAPAVHGYWIVNGVRLDGVIGNFRCSVCMGVSLKDSKYCPNCGTKMDMKG